MIVLADDRAGREEARTHRREAPEPKALHLTLKQGAIVTVPIRSVLFDFAG